MSEIAERTSASTAGGGRRATDGVKQLRLKAVAAVVVGLLAYYGLFRIPFLFPPQQRLWSASYAFGFNNGVAILILVGLLGLIALWSLTRNQIRAWPLDLSFPQARTDLHSLHLAFAGVALFYIAFSLLLYFYYSRTGSWLMWETRHFLHRAQLMEFYGRNPYTQFSAEYGPLLTVTPVYLHMMLRPLGASLEQAYFASHLLLNLGGVACLYYLLSRAKMPAPARVVAFVTLSIAGFAPYMGLNGVLLRYLCPAASLVLGHRALLWAQARPAGARWWLGVIVGILLLVVINILLSPEAALTFALAWLTYAVLIVRGDHRVLLAAFVALAAAGFFCWKLLPPAYYGTLLHFSEGANNLPLLPAAHLLFYLVTIFLIVPPLLAAGVRQGDIGEIPAAAVRGALGVLCLIMVPGALGRCDPPHVLFFGMPASLLLLIGLANRSRTAFWAYAVTYAIVFIMLMQIVNVEVFFHLSPRQLFSSHPLATLRRHLHSASGTDHPSAQMLAALDRYPQLGLPFATFGDPVVEKYVITHGKLAPEYYISVVGVYNEAALQRKLTDVGQTELLLLPKKLVGQSKVNPCQVYLKDIRHWFLYPAKLACRAEPLDPGAAVAKFISQHYAPVQNIGEWVVLRRNSAAVSANSNR